MMWHCRVSVPGLPRRETLGKKNEYDLTGSGEPKPALVRKPPWTPLSGPSRDVTKQGQPRHLRARRGTIDQFWPSEGNMPRIPRKRRCISRWRAATAQSRFWRFLVTTDAVSLGESLDNSF